jgi:hypothetical protein
MPAIIQALAAQADGLRIEGEAVVQGERTGAVTPENFRALAQQAIATLMERNPATAAAAGETVGFASQLELALQERLSSGIS